MTSKTSVHPLNTNPPREQELSLTTGAVLMSASTIITLNGRLLRRMDLDLKNRSSKITTRSKDVEDTVRRGLPEVHLGSPRNSSPTVEDCFVDDVRVPMLP